MVKTSGNSWEKKWEELNWILPLANHFGNRLEGICLTEKPDFHLHFPAESIGLEFTKYIFDQSASELAAFQNLLNEYAEKHFDIEKKKHLQLYKDFPYRIKVWFTAGLRPCIVDGTKVKCHKEEVFAELNAKLFGTSNLTYSYKYIDCVSAEPLTNQDDSVNSHSVCQIIYIETYQNVIDDILIKCIREKELKLKEYLAIPRNKYLTDWWLAIGITEAVDIHSIQLPDNFTTNYSRIFVIKGASIKQII